MRSPDLRITPNPEPESWLFRIRENLAQLLAPTKLTPSSSSGAPMHAPIHLMKLGQTRVGSAQTVSFVTHAAVLIALLLAAHTKIIGTPAQTVIDTISPMIYAPPSSTILSRPSLGRSGGGGDENPLPPTHGFLPPRSTIQLISPRRPDGLEHPLPAPVTILDQQAPPVVTSVPEIGLPWMKTESNSSGPGKNGVGTRGEAGMGDKDGLDAGEDVEPGYAPGITSPVCSYCPLPIYTDEARHVKVQGTVLLHVLVTTDGKASRIRVVRGVGYGLEERAIETVHSWKFLPAHDAAKRPVAAWVTIEAVFRLF